MSTTRTIALVTTETSETLDAAEAHEALCVELADAASTLDAVGAEGYVLLRGQGDGCDVWARYTTV